MIIWYAAAIIITLIISSIFLAVDCEIIELEQGKIHCKNVQTTALTIIGILFGGPPATLILNAVLNRRK